MSEPSERQLGFLYELFEGLPRKAPGSESSTRRALAMCAELPRAPRIIDFGCGSGASTLVLARETGGHVTGVDLHRPWVDALARSAADAGLSSQVAALCADMGAPGFDEGAFDLVWSEGAIYHLGFADGLRRWRPLLRAGGYIAVTEATWLVDQPPAEVAAFWSDAYPAITSIERNRSMLRDAGLDEVDHFVLPAADWTTFYERLASRLEEFRERYAADEGARAVIDATQSEIDVWRSFGETYGYAFFIGRRLRD